MPNCNKHNDQPIKLLCLEKMCKNRLVCQSCLAESHNRHDVIYISKQIKQFSNLHRNSQKPGAEQKRIELQSYLEELRQKSLEIQMEIKFWIQNIASAFFQDFATLCQTFSSKYAENIWKILNKEQLVRANNLDKKAISQSQIYLRQLDKIAKDIRFVGNQFFEQPVAIIKAAEIIYKQVSIGLQNCKIQINSAMMDLTKIMSTLNFSNIENILKDFKVQEITDKKKKANIERYMERQDDESINRVVKKRKLCESNLQRQAPHRQFSSIPENSAINDKKEANKNQKQKLLEKHKQQMLREVFSFMEEKQLQSPHQNNS